MILLDYKDSRPIYEQVVEKLQELMLLGVLEEDDQMPSVRSLAMELSINPNTACLRRAGTSGIHLYGKGTGKLCGKHQASQRGQKTKAGRKHERAGQGGLKS